VTSFQPKFPHNTVFIVLKPTSSGWHRSNLWLNHKGRLPWALLSSGLDRFPVLSLQPYTQCGICQGYDSPQCILWGIERRRPWWEDKNWSDIQCIMAIISNGQAFPGFTAQKRRESLRSEESLWTKISTPRSLHQTHDISEDFLFSTNPRSTSDYTVSSIKLNHGMVPTLPTLLFSPPKLNPAEMGRHVNRNCKGSWRCHSKRRYGDGCWSIAALLSSELTRPERMVDLAQVQGFPLPKCHTTTTVRIMPRLSIVPEENHWI
jgi:hypothetical protein